jgi:hypothetical protein
MGYGQSVGYSDDIPTFIPLLDVALESDLVKELPSQSRVVEIPLECRDRDNRITVDWDSNC